MTPSLPVLDAAVVPAPTSSYRCPGESYPIDRAVHLGRLAAFYPACRGCVHRHDSGPLSTAQRQQLAELDGRDRTTATFHSEGIAGVAGNQLGATEVRQTALAMGIHLQQSSLALQSRATPAPMVVLGGDGRAITAELVSAASEGIRRAGCTAIEIGAATCGSLAEAIARQRATGGLLIGNPGGEPHVAGIKFWGPGGIPWSADGNLDAIAQLVSSGVQRPVRHYGGVERQSLTTDYLAARRELFHALRPLRLVLATVSTPTARHLSQLLGDSACEIATLRQPEQATVQAGRLAPRPNAAELRHAAHERRLLHLGEQIRQDGAHLGIWIDGDGDCLQLFDQQGRAISGQRLLVGLARAVLTDRPGGVVLLENTAEEHTARLLADCGAQVVRCPPTRESMALAMCEHAALLGGGPSGRLWWSAALAQQMSAAGSALGVSGPPESDVLLTIGVLFNSLSQSDRPLSEVLDAA